MFATHYHELTDLAENDQTQKIKNFCVAVNERDNEIVFLRRIKPGGADKSYGIQVAKLAGLPKSVMKRAETILTELESGERVSNVKPLKKSKSEKISQTDQNSSLFSSDLPEQIAKLDLNTTTPIEAINILYKLQSQARKELGLSAEG